MKIKVLGPGCKNCEVLYSITQEAVKQLNLSNVIIEYVKDMNEIAKYNIMVTPGLVINEIVVHEGKPIPNIIKVKNILQEFADTDNT